MARYTKDCVLGNKFQCKRCGKQVYAFNLDKDERLCVTMLRKHICWECAYWEWFLSHLPERLEIIGNKCYQIFPFIKNPNFNQILGDNGKVKYLLKKDGSCIRTNDTWLINTIPFKYQDKLPPTGWWATKRVYKSLQRSQHKCVAKGCLDRYHCYRYQYQIEFDAPIYNKVPKDWIVGSERCPAFIPLIEIKGYDEYVKPSDIIDESSIVHKS